MRKHADNVANVGRVSTRQTTTAHGDVGLRPSVVSLSNQEAANPPYAATPLGKLTKNFDSVRVPVKGSDRKLGKYPYYGASGIVDHVDGFLFDGEYLLIAEDGENLRTRQTPVAFMATGKFWVNNHAHIVQGNDRALTRYLSYALSQTDISGFLSGSTMPKLTQGNMNRIPVIEPPLPEQKAIAHILGTLDDKIELNRRMNATLEAMARALFQSWFVDFDPVRAKLDGRQPAGLDATTAALFPAHFQDSSLGYIPQEWRAASLGNVLEISDSKRIPLSGREREKRQGPYPYHGAASVMDYIDDFLFDGIYVLMGEDGSVINDDGTPVLQYVWGKFWVNNHAHVLRGTNGICTEHLLLHLKNCNIAAFVTGAVQPKLNQGNMNRIEFILPPPEIGKAFAKIIEPLFAQTRANTEQSRILATLRDTLLPKLLSGELSVSERIAEATT